MSRVVVWPARDADGQATPVTYQGATGINYDPNGYIVIVTATGDDPEPVAVWAPGQWQRAEVEGSP